MTQPGSAMPSSSSGARTAAAAPFVGVTIAAAAMLLVVSQASYFSDEGYHLLAARRVLSGDRPYADFFYQQSPLYPYLLGAWMRIAGDGWRSAHVLSAILALATAWLAAGVVRSSADTELSRKAGPALAMLFVGLNGLVVRFGTLAMPFIAAGFLAVSAYRCALKASAAGSTRAAFFAGLFGGAAAWSCLLAAPALPVLGLWLVRPSRKRRPALLLSFVAGALIVTLPVGWIVSSSPALAWFDMVTYHFTYGRGWGANAQLYSLSQDALRLLGLAYLGEGLLLIPLAIIGVAGQRRAGSEREPSWRSPVILAMAMAVALIAVAALARPTFPIYFLIAWPFLGVAATTGACRLSSRARVAPVTVVWALLAIFSVALARPMWTWLRMPSRWVQLEHVGGEIRRRLPPESTLLADERLYFVAGWVPRHTLEIAPQIPAWIVQRGHLIPLSAVLSKVQEGSLRTVVFEPGDTSFTRLLDLCADRAQVDDFYIVSGCTPHPEGPAGR